MICKSPRYRFSRKGVGTGIPNVSLHNNPILASIGASQTIEGRFWNKVTKTESCWIWSASLSGERYGTILLGRSGQKKIKAHILSWILRHNQLPPVGMSVCHNCPGGDNPKCVNPDHLWIGTHQDNMRDRTVKRGTPKQPNQFRDGFGNRKDCQ